MNVDNTIDTLNKYIRDTRCLLGINNNSFLVGHKSITNASKLSKLMKKYELFVYLVKNKKDKVHECVFHFIKIYNSALVSDEEAYNDINQELLLRVLNSIRDTSFDKILNYETD